jgi:hypothetical protein
MTCRWRWAEDGLRPGAANACYRIPAYPDHRSAPAWHHPLGALQQPDLVGAVGQQRAEMTAG